MNHYEDNFAHKHLPHPSLQAMCTTGHADFELPENLNCVEQLLDRHIAKGNGDKIAIRTFDRNWTFNTLYEKANQIASVLINDLNLVPGNRVMIRSANNPMYVACWFGILKAGGIVVATMPLLREKELSILVECAEISHVFCDQELEAEIKAVKSPFLKHIISFVGTGKAGSELANLMETRPKTFSNHPTKADSIAIIGFTSGTTGRPKMTAHFHKDILLICEAFPKSALQPTPDDIFIGSPPLGFTFGLGGLVLFPFNFGASTFLLEKPSPDMLLKAISEHGVTICFTAPTAWRILTEKVKNVDISSLRKCVSAGEALPLKVWQDWYDTTGIKIINGIGSTEILHIFIASNEEHMRAGATGVPVRGYEAKIIDQKGNEITDGSEGRLAVRGITGCKYLKNPPKQKEYVQQGWNITGDIFKKDKDGYFWFVARNDDMIISSGYNIAAIEVESVLLDHQDIAECAVVGIPDENRGMLVCAYIVLKEPEKASGELTKAIQDWFKNVAAPYKYPREIRYVDALPKTETGKIQRFKLKTIVKPNETIISIPLTNSNEYAYDSFITIKNKLYTDEKANDIPMKKAFVKKEKVRFQHVDYAGIVFYPRFLEMLNTLVEDFFEEALHRPFKDLHVTGGIPTVDLKVQFKKAARLGDELTKSIWIKNLGSSSMTCDFTFLHADDSVCLAGEVSLVNVHFNNERNEIKSSPFTDEMRHRLSAYFFEGTETSL